LSADIHPAIILIREKELGTEQDAYQIRTRLVFLIL